MRFQVGRSVAEFMLLGEHEIPSDVGRDVDNFNLEFSKAIRERIENAWTPSKKCIGGICNSSLLIPDLAVLCANVFGSKWNGT
jgi:hypothetical protein